MSGPDPGDSADKAAGGDDTDRRQQPSSDGDDPPDETHDEPSTADPTRDGDDPPRRAGGEPDEGPATADGNGTAGGEGDAHTTAPGPNGESPDGNGVSIEDDGVVRWFLRTDDGTVVFARDVLSSVAIVAILGLLLFGLSGVWPPLVAVESGSMEPNMERGDLIFVVDDDRFVGDDPVDGTGIVPLENGQESGHEKFGKAGDVVVFRPDGSDRETPIIHRVHFWVEEGENWVDTKATEEYVNGNSCDDLAACPANHDGFITKGDANPGYDQAGSGGVQTNQVVKPEWVSGKAMFRIPYLGHVRLTFDAILGGTATPSPSIVGASPVETGATGTTTAAIGIGGVAATGATAAVAITRRRYRTT